MEHQLTIYNTLDRKKELFVPLHAPHVGMYVCGPTVYGDAHLGHARPAITFDVLFRYLTHLGYKVRYVRNITDVGHLEHDADEGEEDLAVQGTRNRIDVPFFELQFIAQEVADHARRRSSQFQADSRPFAAFLQALFDFHQEVFGIVVDIQVGVAGDAERFDFQDVAAQEEAFRISGDDVFQEEELMTFMLLASRPGP